MTRGLAREARPTSATRPNRSPARPVDASKGSNRGRVATVANVDTPTSRTCHRPMAIGARQNSPHARYQGWKTGPRATTTRRLIASASSQPVSSAPP